MLCQYLHRRGAYKVLVGETVGKRPLGRPRPRWKENIKMDLQEVGWRGMDWIGLAQVTVVNAVVNLAVSIKCEELLDYLGNC
jgi:hypothetical protein